MNMEYYVYVNVPDYTKEYVLNHFADKNDPTAVNVKSWEILHGFIVENLRTRSVYCVSEERGNLKVIIPDSRAVRRRDRNYMTTRSRNKLACLFREIMISHFWREIMPEWRMMMVDRNKRASKHIMDKYIIDFFDRNGMTYTESGLNNFKRYFVRERKRIQKKLGIMI